MLVHEQGQATNGEDEPFVPLDEDYLNALGLRDQLPEMREIAASTAEALAHLEPPRHGDPHAPLELRKLR